MNALQIADRDNELLRSADEYLRKHKLLELFEVRPLFTFFTLSSFPPYQWNIETMCMCIGLDDDSLL